MIVRRPAPALGDQFRRIAARRQPELDELDVTEAVVAVPPTSHARQRTGTAPADLGFADPAEIAMDRSPAPPEVNPFGIGVGGRRRQAKMPPGLVHLQEVIAEMVDREAIIEDMPTLGWR
jgi:hypothetical protein